MVGHFGYYRNLSEDKAIKHGHLPQKLPNFNLDIYTTPTHHLLKKENPAVLLTTGGFAPLHDGHIEMMEKAKEALESKGYNVVGGYFNHSHDSYVKTKDEHWIMDANIRIQQGRDKIENIEWLEVDPWGSLYVPEDIDFTTVYERMKAYLKRWHGDCEVIYVYGSDNDFGPAWSKGKAICVKRPGHPLEEHKNVINVEANNLDASREIRKQLKKEKKVEKKQFIVLRNDIKHILKDENFKGKEQELTIIFENIKYLLNKYSGFKIVETEIDRDQSFVDSLEEKTLSIDKCVVGDYNFDTSRSFFAAANQQKSHSQCIDFENFDIPKGLTLIDDDVSTGSTLSLMKERFEPTQVYLTIMENLKSLNYNHADCYDVIDFRDFIYGAPDGGLLTQFGRQIYALPYVNLAKRASIFPEYTQEFSKEIWKLNKTLHRGNVTVARIIEKHIKLLSY